MKSPPRIDRIGATFRDLQKPYSQPSDLVAGLDAPAFRRVSVGAVLRFGE